MFTVEGRERLAAALIEAARADDRIAGLALTGSASVGRTDRWSDIDLALAVAGAADRDAVVADWTDRMYRQHDAVHHLDVWLGATRFRVFLLADTLQVDLAFWPETEFGPIGRTFRLVFGTAADRAPVPAPRAADLIGFAWLYALHARSSVARGRIWQARYMVDHMRDQIVALACLRCGLPTAEGRGVDALPAEVLAALGSTVATATAPAELARALRELVPLLLTEAERADPALAERLRAPLLALAG